MAQIAPAEGPGYRPPANTSLSPRQTDFEVIGQVLYDSNVARSSAELAQHRGLTLEDEIFSPAVRFNIVRPLGRESVFLNGSAGYDFYRTNSILNRERLDLRGGGSGRLAICDTTISGGYDHSQSDLAQTSVVAVKNVVNHESVALNATCGRRIGLAPTFSVSQSWLSNSAPALVGLNSSSFSASAGLAYRRPTFGNLSVTGSYTDTNYPDRFLNMLGLSRGYKIYTGGVSFDRRLGARIETVASVSYTSLNPTLPGSKRFRGLTYSVDATYRVTSRIQAHAEFVRAAAPSNRINSNYSIDQTLALDGTYRAGQRLTFRLGVSRASQDYGVVPNLALVDLTSERLYDIFGSVAYRFNRRLSLNLNARHEQRDANLSRFSYSDNRIGLTATAGF